MKTPGVAPRPGMTFGRDLGGNTTQIRQRGGFILAWNPDLGQFKASPAAAPSRLGDHKLAAPDFMAVGLVSVWAGKGSASAPGLHRRGAANARQNRIMASFSVRSNTRFWLHCWVKVTGCLASLMSNFPRPIERVIRAGLKSAPASIPLTCRQEGRRACSRRTPRKQAFFHCFQCRAQERRRRSPRASAKGDSGAGRAIQFCPSKRCKVLVSLQGRTDPFAA
jgi:hypothetical protein